MNALAVKAISSLAIGIVLIGATIFLSAGTVQYWQGWVFLVLYSIGAIGTSAYFWKTDPALFERRLKSGPLAEGEPAQKAIIALFIAGFVGLLAVSGLDRRFGWSIDAPAIAIAGDLTFALGFVLVSMVMHANSFAAATVQIAEGQTVVSTGPYAIVRHPMYTTGLLLLAGIPLALGSYWGLLVLGAMIPVLVWRLLNEEAFLAKNLPGYDEYQKKVRWRLLPGVF